jgi:hypothetical protein
MNKGPITVHHKKQKKKKKKKIFHLYTKVKKEILKKPSTKFLQKKKRKKVKGIIKKYKIKNSTHSC